MNTRYSGSGMKLNLLPEEKPLWEKASFRTAGKIGIGIVAIGAIIGGLLPGCQANEGKAYALDPITGLEGKVSGSVELSGAGSRILPRYEVEKLTINFSSPGDYTIQLVRPMASKESSTVQGLATGWTRRVSVRGGTETVELTRADGVSMNNFIEIMYEKPGDNSMTSTFVGLNGR